jgi:hypothetical protein
MATEASDRTIGALLKVHSTSLCSLNCRDYIRMIQASKEDEHEGDDCSLFQRSPWSLAFASTDTEENTDQTATSHILREQGQAAPYQNVSIHEAKQFAKHPVSKHI